MLQFYNNNKKKTFIEIQLETTFKTKPKKERNVLKSVFQKQKKIPKRSTYLK